MRWVEGVVRIGRLEIAYIRNFSWENVNEGYHVGEQDVGARSLSASVTEK
jgi:hypothetical protein